MYVHTRTHMIRVFVDSLLRERDLGLTVSFHVPIGRIHIMYMFSLIFTHCFQVLLFLFSFFWLFACAHNKSQYILSSSRSIFVAFYDISWASGLLLCSAVSCQVNLIRRVCLRPTERILIYRKNLSFIVYSLIFQMKTVSSQVKKFKNTMCKNI